MAIIKVDQVSKSFQRQKRKPGLLGSVQGFFHREYEVKQAVNQISFDVQKGEILGYLGPNGAGKSTTIKMMVGLLMPTAGTIEVNGIVPYRNRIENAKQIGVVFGQRTQLWWDIPVIDSIELIRYMYKIPAPQYSQNLKLFSDMLGLDEFLHVPVRQLSLGQRMRADLCAALLHDPDIIYLDEPTIGLDVAVKANIRSFIHELNQKRETTVILTTHDTTDIEKLCSRVMVIDQGAMMYEGSLEQLKTKYGSDEHIIMEVAEPPTEETLREIGLPDATFQKNKLHVRYDRSAINSTEVLKRLMSRVEIKDFVVKETGVEDIIRKLYNRESAVGVEVGVS